MPKTKALDPQKMAKPSLLVWVWILIMCAENVYHRFPSIVFKDWRLIPYRSSSYQDELNLPPCSTVYNKPCFIVPLYVIALHPCSPVYNKHSELLDCWGISTWDSRWHNPSSSLSKPTPHLLVCLCACPVFTLLPPQLCQSLIKFHIARRHVSNRRALGCLALIIIPPTLSQYY